MKPVIYIGVALMAGSSVYGINDYRKASHEQAFRSLYETKKLSAPSTESPSSSPFSLDNKGQAVNEIAGQVKDIVNTGATSITKGKWKPKRINYKLFSRAALEARDLDSLPVVADPIAPPSGNPQ